MVYYVKVVYNTRKEREHNKAMNEPKEPFSDLLQLVDEAELEQKCRRRNRARVISFALAAALVLGGLAVGIYSVYADLIGRIAIEPGTRPSGYMVAEEESEAPDPNFEAMYDITDTDDLHDFLQAWWYNGGDDKIRYSKDVTNVLLLGEDDPDGAEYGRSDSIMLVSINKKTRMVTTLSFLRDSYCYMNVNGEERWTRLNAAFSTGGPAGMMEAVSRLFKIRVDRYVTVNFSAFKRLIDTLGGVRVNVTEYEAKYINRTAPSMNRAFPAGENVALNGAQALVYCRIRKLDTDGARARRQQKVIQAILQKARSASLGDIYDALGGVLENITANYSTDEITALIPKAMTWVNYGVQQMVTPLDGGDAQSAIGAAVNGAFVWLVDFPLAAHQVQMALYGESNINLDAGGGDRNDYILSLFRGAADRGTLEGDSLPESTARFVTESSGAVASAPEERIQTAPEERSQTAAEESLAEGGTPPPEETAEAAVEQNGWGGIWAW